MRRLLLLLWVFAVVFSGCDSGEQEASIDENAPKNVKLIHTGTKWQMLVNGEPFYIYGGGTETMYIGDLAARGGNSIRAWRTDDAPFLLDSAHACGLTVTMGIDVHRERHGFDYNDTAAVAEQLEHIREQVLEYKDHPALIMWGIGNELNLRYTNPAVWDAVNEIAEMIQELDTNHLVTTMFAGIEKREIDYIKEKCPALDLICIQAYGGLPGIPQKIRDAGYEGAYVITEWGPTGHWEVPRTEWDVAVEETSRQKAVVYEERYKVGILADTVQCLGSYVFFWSQKQERTPTWYGLFLETGESSEVADVMEKMWTGKWPENRAPSMDSMRLDGMSKYDNVYLSPGEPYIANMYVTEHDGDSLKYVYEVLKESTDLKDGGDWESRPDSIPEALGEINGAELSLIAPADTGAYRLFFYAFDGKGHACNGNIPFFVKEPEEAFVFTY